jgi:hypothetical protein
MGKKLVPHNTVTHRVTKNKKNQEKLYLPFCLVAEKVFGELELVEQISEEYEEGYFSDDYYFGTKTPNGEINKKITICLPEYSNPLLVLESSDYNQIKDLLGISSKMFKHYFGLWFFKKYPEFKNRKYEFVLSSPFLD